MEPPADHLTPERRDQILGRFARWIVGRRLPTPAPLKIEMNRPLTTMGANACHFGAPVLGPLFGERVLSDVGLVMEDRSNVDRLVAEIERLVGERDSLEEEPVEAGSSGEGD